MAKQAVHFELSTAVLLTVAGFWLVRENFADAGLMVVGFILLALTLASRAGVLKRWLRQRRTVSLALRQER